MTRLILVGQNKQLGYILYSRSFLAAVCPILVGGLCGYQSWSAAANVVVARAFETSLTTAGKRRGLVRYINIQLASLISYQPQRRRTSDVKAPSFFNFSVPESRLRISIVFLVEFLSLRRPSVVRQSSSSTRRKQDASSVQLERVQRPVQSSVEHVHCPRRDKTTTKTMTRSVR